MKSNPSAPGHHSNSRWKECRSAAGAAQPVELTLLPGVAASVEPAEPMRLPAAAHKGALVVADAPPEPPADDVQPRPGVIASVGTGVTEAPRGLLLHHYEIDQDGTILHARIMPPTSQNQLTIEADLRRVVQGWLDLSDDDLQWRCEQAVRNHDPCISCAAHFLDVSVVTA